MDQINIIEGASIFNIDFAAGLFSCLINNDQTHKILFNSHPSIDHSSIYRKFMSRLSIPLFRWKFSDNKHFNEKTWYLEFLPIDDFSVENLQDKILIIQNNIDEVICETKDQKLAISIKDRISRILSPSHTIAESSYVDWNIQWYACIITHIYEQVLNKGIQMEFIHGFNNLNSSVCNSISSLLTRLVKELSIHPLGAIYRFVKGGKIIIRRTNDITVVADSVSLIEKNILQLANLGTGDKYKYEFNNGWDIDGFEFSCYGPIQLLLLSGYGKLVHVPWYSEVKRAKYSSTCYEFISPISSSSRLRVSKKGGGNGYRLTPSGYSLLDYECIEVLTLIRALVKDDKISFSSLGDWRFLADNYPISNEKVAEHQGEIKPYLTRRLNDIRTLLRKRNVLSCKTLFSNVFDLSFSEYGLYILEAIAFFKKMREVHFPNSQTFFSISEVNFFVSQGYIEFDNSFNVSKLICNIEIICKNVINKLKALGLDGNECDAVDARISNCILIIKRINYVPIGKVSIAYYKNLQSLYSIINILNTILYHYYSFVIFFISTVLKANIFSAIILFGADQYRKHIQDIVEKRKNVKFLNLDPVYLKK